MKITFEIDLMGASVYALDAADNIKYLELEQRKREMTKELFSLMKCDGDV
jgi:hypothetical protein